MNVLSGFVQYGMAVQAEPSRTNVSNDQTIGVPSTRINLRAGTDVDFGYSVKAVIATGTFRVNSTTGSTTGSTAWSAGVAQSATITLAGTTTAAGNVNITVTSAGMAGSPLTVIVPVLISESASVVAGKVRTALAANTVISSRFTVSGTGANVTIARRPLAIEGAAINYGNDATLALVQSNGSPSPGLDPHTTDPPVAGVASTGVFIFDSGVDFEGKALSEIVVVGSLIQVSPNGGAVSQSESGGVITNRSIPSGGIVFDYFPSDPGDGALIYDFEESGGLSIVTFNAIGSLR